MTQDLSELEEIVTELNDEIQNQNENLLPFELSTDGNEQWVKFFGQPLWDSETDEREWENHGGGEDDVQEPIAQYLRREAGKMIQKIGSLNIEL